MNANRVVRRNVHQITEHDLPRDGGKGERANFEVAILNEEIVDDLGDDVAHQARVVEDDIADPHHGHKPDDEDEAIAEEEVQPVVDC